MFYQYEMQKWALARSKITDFGHAKVGARLWHDDSAMASGLCWGAIFWPTTAPSLQVNRWNCDIYIYIYTHIHEVRSHSERVSSTNLVKIQQMKNDNACGTNGSRIIVIIVSIIMLSIWLFLFYWFIFVLTFLILFLLWCVMCIIIYIFWIYSS